jgi:flavin-dependent dehydrogenase
MEKTIHESNEIPVTDTYDVIIVGGGIAAVGAALAARRQGCRVLVIEKSVILGGLATLGFIAYYLPLCDGKGKKVSGGIAEELLHLSIKYGYGDLDPQWKGLHVSNPKIRYTTQFSPPEFVYALDELMLSENVDILFDTVFCKPIMENGRCRAVIVENKTGRSAYVADMFIDASGDADLCFRAGAKYVEEKNYLA